MGSGANDDGAPAHTTLRTSIATVTATILTASPVFLLGGLATLVRRDLGFDEQALGAAVAAFFLGSALAAAPGGRLADRIGPRASLLGTTIATATILLATAAFVQTWGQLATLLFVAGVCNGIGQPASNLAIARTAARHLQGLVFGAKQAAVPAAALLGGFSVPVVGLTLGWRWAFVFLSVLLIPIVLTLPARMERRSAVTRRDRRRTGATVSAGLVTMSIGGTLGAAGANSLSAFLVESSVASGLSPGAAGVLLGCGSALGVLSRIVVGWHADRHATGHLKRVALLVLGGALGYGLLAFSDNTAALLTGTMIGFLAGWGWPGLYTFAVARLHEERPAAATGVIQSGMFLGGVLGPFTFGTIVVHASYEAAWLTIAGASLLAVLLLSVGRVLLARRQPVTASTVHPTAPDGDPPSPAGA